MDWLWTWKGKSFGYRDGDNLWTHGGKHVGRFDGDEVFAPNGKYLGEVRIGKLITRKSNKRKLRSPFSPLTSRGGTVKQVNHGGNAMLAGYEDFPAPDELQSS